MLLGLILKYPLKFDGGSVTDLAVAPLFPWGQGFGERVTKPTLGAEEREKDKPVAEVWRTAQADFFYRMWDK